MSKYFIAIVMVLMFGGCGINDKVSTVLHCEKGEVYFTVYKESLVTRDTDIIRPVNIVAQGYYERDNRRINCE